MSSSSCEGSLSVGCRPVAGRVRQKVKHSSNALLNAPKSPLSPAGSIGITRLEAHVAPDNHASRRVAEAAGFTQAGNFTDGGGTEFIRYIRDASGDGAAPFTK